MSSKAELLANIRELEDGLSKIDGQLKEQPDNAEFLILKEDLAAMIASSQAELDDILAKEPSKPRTVSGPAAQPEATTADLSKPTKALQLNDEVEARWLSGDKMWYSAKVVSITGSAANPVYVVKFTDYSEKDTVRSNDIRPLHSNPHDPKKRKADAISSSGAFSSDVASASATPTTATAVGPRANTGVITAAANVNPELASKARANASDSNDDNKGNRPGDKVFKKIRSSKQLNAGQQKWQEFAAKGKGKIYKKDSMFRTGDALGSRVGFVGSGQAMREDPARQRNSRGTREVSRDPVRD